MENGKIQRTKFVFAAVGLCVISALAATGLAHYLRQQPEAPSGSDQSARPDVPKKLFQGWPKPDVVLVLSGDQHGYLLPCGCSRPQVGGLERRYNLLEKLKKAGWPVVPVDLGDIPQTSGPHHLPNVQGMLKYQTSMKALKLMNYQAVGIGQHETSLGLLDTLAAFRLEDNSIPVLSANLKDKVENFAGLVDSVKMLTPPGGPRIGISSVVGPTVEKKIIDRAVKLESNQKILPQLAKQMDTNKVELGVLLYQGTDREAFRLSKDFPQFDVILYRAEESEPPAQPTKVGNNVLINVGHKGRYVGVLGVYKTGNKDKPLELRYELVSLTEDFLTGKDEKNPVVDLMEKYTKTLKDDNYLARYPRRKHQNQLAVPGKVPTYVGSQVCAKCHKREFQVWQKSKHANAYNSLVTATNPSNRQYDAECIVCHTVGFGYESGYTDAQKTAHLKGVGCESCHGPGSEHATAKNKYDERWHKLMNPWRSLKGDQKKLKIDRFCQSCHDIDNDVHYKFEKRWPPIEH